MFFELTGISVGLFPVRLLASSSKTLFHQEWELYFLVKKKDKEKQ